MNKPALPKEVSTTDFWSHQTKDLLAELQSTTDGLSTTAANKFFYARFKL